MSKWDRLPSVVVVAMTAVLLSSAAATAQQPLHRGTHLARTAALAQCGTYKNSWFDGYFGTIGQGATEGVYATISSRVGTACGSDHDQKHNAISAWALVGSGDTTSTGGWVQSGIQAGYGQCLTYFAQTLKNHSSGLQT